MKVSRYNILVKLSPTESLIYNSHSGALSKIDSHLAEVIGTSDSAVNEDGLSKLEIQALAEMLRCGYIIDDNVDEVKKIQAEIAEQRCNKNQLKLVIAPTLDCNFGCPYCFEQPKHGQMDQLVQKAIKELLRQKLSMGTIERVSVVWYGGEPLLAKALIFSLSQDLIGICRKFNVHYRASIITNGYLIDEDTAERMYENHIRFAQITVDGSRMVHNQRRFLRTNPEIDTYSKIIDGINILNLHNIHVSVRINVDTSNQVNIKHSVQELSDEISDKQRTNIYLGHVFSYENGALPNECLTKEEFCHCQMDCALELKNVGFDQALKRLYPKKRIIYCSAPLDNVFVIDPFGFLYKCWNDICEQEHSIGTVQEYINGYPMQAETEKWSNYSALEKEPCSKCTLFPICGGGCPRQVIHLKSDNVCEYTEAAIRDMMYLQYSMRHKEGG